MAAGIVFDLDGTLVDSLPGIAASLNAALDDHGHHGHPLGSVREFVGSGVFMLCRRALPAGSSDELVHQVASSFKGHYATAWPDGSSVFPGIGDLIRLLAASGTRLAVLSNKPDAFTREMVEHFFPGRPFEMICGQLEGVPPKPDPAALGPILDAWVLPPAALQLVGDSNIDRRTAAAADIPFIGVAWGYEDAGVLGPCVVRSVDELARALM